MAKSDHLHKYKKVNIGQNGKIYIVYRCVKMNCSHYVPLIMAEGKACECNICGQLMLITKEVLNHSSNQPMAKPRCPDCIKRKVIKPTEVDAIAEFLNKKESS